jgi:ABC-type branched-subunit amino acid transport system ATPase component
MERFPVLREKSRAQASTLSGGQQKILEIARGLLRDPKLMLIDEPSIGLSPILVRDIFGILRELCAKGVTILMVGASCFSIRASGSSSSAVLRNEVARLRADRRRHPGLARTCAARAGGRSAGFAAGVPAH